MITTTRREAIVLYALLAISSLACTFLGYRLWARDHVSSASSGTLAIGTHVPPLALVDVAGKPLQLRFEDQTQPTILYAFAPGCGWCRKNLASIKQLASAVDGRFRVVAVSIDQATPLGPYVQSSGLSFPAYAVASSRAVTDLSLRSVPQTLVVSSAGVVEKAWGGAYMGSNKGQIERYFSVALPDIEAVDAEGTFCYDEAGRAHSMGSVLHENGEFKRCNGDGHWSKWTPAARG